MCRRPRDRGPHPLSEHVDGGGTLPAPGGAVVTRVLMVTGTDTDVGKTIVTAALAAVLDRQAPGTVHVDKPAQTGVAPGDPGDAAEVARLSGVTRVSEGVRLMRPMAPLQAARREGVTLPTVADQAARLDRLLTSTPVSPPEHPGGPDAGIGTLLVEGAGGLLVELDARGGTIADLALALSARGHRVETVVVARPHLGTLNHSLLTLEACATRGLDVTGLVLGTWPADPGAVETDTRAHLSDASQVGVPMLGALPENAARLTPAQFRDRAAGWLPGLGR